jgi:SAM-dependent methyltransferase
VIPLTKEYVERAGMSAQIDCAAGDYNEDELGRDYDLVFMSSIVHINSLEQNQELIAKGARALKTGGRLVVRDFVVDNDRTGPLWGIMFALNMLVNTEQGDTYTKDEIFGWFGRAGLERFEIIGGVHDSALVIAYKP